jgi:hypothetical protein
MCKESKIDQKIAEILEEIEERRKTLSREEALKGLREIFNIPEDDDAIP